MATVKIKFIRHGSDLVKYLLAERQPIDPIDSHNCHESSVFSDFQEIKKLHNGKGEINAIHVVQSWNAEESKKVTPQEFNLMGRELVEQHFPGHAFIVITHTNTGKFHNHIVVCPWHSETGKKIENTKAHWPQLCAKNDAICKSRGLSTIERNGKLKRDKLPEKVQKIARFQGYSWILDLCSKADFARAYSTSYDEYVGILKEFGVKARVEEKNITYYYGGHSRGKRGSKLGKPYDKKGLEKSFLENDKKFAEVPYLREQVRGIVSTASTGKVSPLEAQRALLSLPGSTFQRGQKDYSRFTKIDRTGRAQLYPHELDLNNSILPVDELRRARNSSIFEYCKRNKITLEKKEDGKHVLKGRPFVEINEFEWVNKRNRTKGSLIELVAAHKNLTFIQAVADINANSRLLILEKHLGKQARNYTSFYIPKQEQASGQKAVAHVGKLLAHFGGHEKQALHLLKSGQVQVSDKGLIRLFSSNDEGGAFEFTLNDEGKWTRTKVGSFNSSFFSALTGRRKATLYLDPFSFLKEEGKSALLPHQSRGDVICLMEPNEKILSGFLAGNRNLSQLEVFLPSNLNAKKGDLDFFNTLKTSLKGLGIEVTKAPSRNQDKEREVDLPLF